MYYGSELYGSQLKVIISSLVDYLWLIDHIESDVYYE